MKCDKCGFIPNPGDQVCINCGAKLSTVNAYVPEIEKTLEPNPKKEDRKVLIYSIASILIAIVIIVLIIKVVFF